MAPARAVAMAVGAAALVALAAARAAHVAAPPLPEFPALQVENAADGRTLHVALDGGTFEVVSHHSMYDAPVTEEFSVGADGTLRLRAVSSPSAAVREYFGITAPGERHVLERAWPELVFRVAAGREQRLRAGGVERSFLDFGAHGDRLVVRAVARPGLVSARRTP